MAISGCDATGDVGGTRTVRADGVPFTFELPSDFTRETIDDANSRGDVLVAAGLTKVDVVAVRRLSGPAPGGPQRHRVLGQDVTSEVHAVAGAPGFAFECQYTSDRAEKVRSACRDALRSVERK